VLPAVPKARHRGRARTVELTRVLTHHIRRYHKARKTLKWKYLEPTPRIINEADGAVH
jgi:hypothetical protein